MVPIVNYLRNCDLGECVCVCFFFGKKSMDVGEQKPDAGRMKFGWGILLKTKVLNKFWNMLQTMNVKLK